MIRSLFLPINFFKALGLVIAFFVLSWPLPFLLPVAKLLLALFVIIVIIDFFLVFRIKEGILASRTIPAKLSNSDDNKIIIDIENQYQYKVNVQLIDEIPYQFQRRDILFNLALEKGEEKNIFYFLRPTERGTYSFGQLNVYVSSPLRLIQKRYQFEKETEVPVYPSFIQMKKFELLAISNQIQDVGIKKIRRIGHSMEFEQIKEYVSGDDYRTINWKATARRNQLMTNQFQDERSQPIYAIIDKGRNMKMPFDGLSLLDYAINASLAITNIAVKRSDKAGLITFAKETDSFVSAENRLSQIKKIQELLFNVDTNFQESGFAQLFTFIRHRLNQRSLLLLFSNFESLTDLKRALPYLRNISKHHLLVVIFFENTSLNDISQQKAEELDEIYIKTIAEKFIFEKKQIVQELKKHGIQAILTPPKQLTVNTINKYLELKSRGLI